MPDNDNDMDVEHVLENHRTEDGAALEDNEKTDDNEHDKTEHGNLAEDHIERNATNNETAIHNRLLNLIANVPSFAPGGLFDDPKAVVRPRTMRSQLPQKVLNHAVAALPR